MSGQWRRVNRAKPCPVCRRDSWCTVSEDGAAAHCMRVQSAKPVATRDGADGWIHLLAEPVPAEKLPPPQPITPTINAESIKIGMQRAMRLRLLKALAERLGVGQRELQRLGIGWSERHGAYAFPMVDGEWHTVGIRLRKDDGRKLSVTGGHEGLFLPMGARWKSPLLICEGPTDTAAMLMLGFDCIGRPSCRRGAPHLLKLLPSIYARRPLVVIVSDRDAPGMEGAESLRKRLGEAGYKAVVIMPPDGIKDARAWLNAGAKRSDIEHAIRDSLARLHRPGDGMRPIGAGVVSRPSLRET